MGVYFSALTLLGGRKAGLGFCHGKNYFCRDSGKTGKKLAKTGKIKDTIY